MASACRTMVRMPRRTRLLSLAVAVGVGLAALVGSPDPAAARPALVPPANDDAAAVDLLLHKRLNNPRLGSDVGLVVLDAATGAVVWIVARVVYVPLYALGIPVLRTLAWTISVVGLVMMLVHLL